MNEIILNDMKTCFGLKADRITPVAGGWLNLKWKVETDQGTLLVKQYSPERFSARKLQDIEAALHRQASVFTQGVSCPCVWQADGRIIQHPAENISYMVMDFAPGRVETPETVTPAQMESLGEGCARMHRAFSEIPACGVKGFPLSGGRIMRTLRETFRKSLEESPPDAPESFRETIARLAPALPLIPEHFSDRLPRAIAHEDFTGDNMLFGDSALSVIVDFDRNQYSFPLHDIGRILLSLALRDGSMDCRKVRAFMDGYARFLPLTCGDIGDALRLTFCIEAPWWLQPGYFQNPSPKAARFVREIQWLGGVLLSGSLPSSCP